MDERPGVHADDVGKLLMRLAVGGLMLVHGISKIMHGIDPIPDLLGKAGLNAVGFIAYGVYVGEVLAPVLILLGFWTRLGAVILTFDMVMALVLVHIPSGDLLKLTGQGGWAIELQAWYFLAALALAFLGAGKISVSQGKGRLD